MVFGSLWPVALFAAGLALILVGLGLTYGYGQVRRFDPGPGADPTAMPHAVVPLIRGLARKGSVSLVAGIVLVVVATVAHGGVPVNPGTLSPRVPTASLLWGSVLGAMLVVLTYNVMHHRVKAMLFPADGQDPERIVRVHANFAEYAPTGLALLLAAELGGAPPLLAHLGGGAFACGRLVHAFGMTRAPLHPGRILGIQLTLFALAYLVVVDLIVVVALLRA